MVITDAGSRSRPPGAARGSRSQPVPVTPYDDHLRTELGEQRWQQYAGDERRRDIAARLTQAAGEGHDVPALISEAVTCRKWEDDQISPARRIGPILLYRIDAAIATGKFRARSVAEPETDPVGTSRAIIEASEQSYRPCAMISSAGTSDYRSALHQMLDKRVNEEFPNLQKLCAAAAPRPVTCSPGR